jgi:hypothetical protein
MVSFVSGDEISALFAIALSGTYSVLNKYLPNTLNKPHKEKSDGDGPIPACQMWMPRSFPQRSVWIFDAEVTQAKSQLTSPEEISIFFYPSA